MNTRFLASISAVAAGASVWYAYGSGKSALDNVLSTSAHPVLSSQRTIFIGDLHSDYKQTLATFRLAGLIGAQSTDWTGGNTTFVQTGDCVDRGDETKEIYDLLEKLREQASQAGGKVITLLGNHEVDLITLSPRALWR